jgi:NAD-dependent DNA ligase
LSIRHIGIETAKDIANHFGTFEKLWSYLLEELEKEIEVEKEKEVEDQLEKEKVGKNEIKGGLENEKIEEKEVEEEVEELIEDQSNVMVSGNRFYFLFFVRFQ